MNATMERICVRKWFEIQKNGCLFAHLANGCQLSKISRFLSSAEVATALRPFYFSVHPDLFGRYPTERTVNENSLKQLSSYIEKLQQNRPTRPTTVKFYLRNKDTKKSDVHSTFRSVRINLVQQDLRKAVLLILKTCDLPTTYIDNIEPSADKPNRGEFRFNSMTFEENDPLHGSFVLKREIKKSKDEEKLVPWLQNNVSDALEKLAATQPIRDEVVRLQTALCDTLGLQSVVWDCGWNVTHFRGCLLSFQALARHHPQLMSSLQGRKLIFANDTGVSLEGHVMLNSGEVRHNWLDLIKNVQTQDEVLFRIPAFEKAVSRVLRDIKIVRRKFQPKVMAKQYEKQLRRLTTSLSDYQGSLGYPKNWPASLSAYELVVETEAGPLMLSPTGQFIVPSSCPAFLLVTFMNENLGEARYLLQQYQNNKYVERELHAQCIKGFGLSALHKDDNITPDLMIQCCERLLKHKMVLAPFLNGVRLSITNYYSVLSNGEMCVPWDWKL